MATKTGPISKPKPGKADFDGASFRTGAMPKQKLIWHLTTDNLKGTGGSAPASGACTIVDEFNTNYALRDHVDISNVKAALNNAATIAKIAKASKADDVLKALGLEGLLLLADYNHLNASRYVKGHLLPQKLGGPGEDFNLVPMNRSANAHWQSSFEKPVRKHLEAALAHEKQIDFRVVVEYKVALGGGSKAWFPNPQATTKKVLAQMPATISGTARIIGFNPKSGGNAKITAAEKAKFSKLFGLSCDLTL